MSQRRGNAAERGDFQIVVALNTEWTALVAEQGDQLDDWKTRLAVFAHCSNLDAVLAVIRESPDPALAALISENHRGSELAGRVVLQTMLGKVVTMARRDRWAGVDDYVTQLWCRIRTYPLARRPRRIAANLALDTLKAVSREDPARRDRACLMLLPPDEVLDRVRTAEMLRQCLDHNADLAGITAWRTIAAGRRLGLINPRTRDVLLSVYAEGLSGREAAARHGMSPDMVRFVCSKAVRRLAAHADELALVA
ncbi:hypothetical protein GCM10009841_04600 [Microlunatus panaciterrae]|uniref:DNA-directed RNA polymerase specialized sigma subunit, sigma24 family n=1 Tax=Microlunatus panaciterrae TaxID=400768 RepID=A0ABS2RJZ0_9ACTN|nr:sigma-70 family RNA polymerase sigma factor [Microlunatus panaciterrae]MBM7798882.1 hypothetical protein [Microlunatus panaciterrae]